MLDDVASILEQCRGLVCWADPNASAFFLLIGTAWALGIAVLGLHTVISFLLCWMVSIFVGRNLSPEEILTIWLCCVVKITSSR